MHKLKIQKKKKNKIPKQRSKIWKTQILKRKNVRGITQIQLQ